MQSSELSDSRYVVTILLAMFLGTFGIHRFYVGKYLSGILMLLTLGGLGIGAMIDIIIILFDGFSDGQGRIVSRNQEVQPTSSRSFIIAIALCAFLGMFGAHRFYAGKTLTGVLMLLTLGGLGIWICIDYFILIVGWFTDNEGKVI
jgi:TM2 domain-containing membrane protein YozV